MKAELFKNVKNDKDSVKEMNQQQQQIIKQQVEERDNFLENVKVIEKEQKQWKKVPEEEKANFRNIMKS